MSVLPLTYPDLVCDDDLDPLATETTSDLANLVQDVKHVLLELPGSNPDDVTRGIGIQTYLSGTTESFKGLPGKIEFQLLQDNRIDSVQCAIVPTGDALEIRIEMAVNGAVLGLQLSYSDANGLTGGAV